MDFRSLALSATLAGSVLLTGLTWSGALNLTDIKSSAFDWANKVGLAVDGSVQMKDKFDTFKADAETQLNAKITKINELNAKIADLVAKVGQGHGDLTDANNEIARLNEELDKANADVQALADEIGLKDAEVQQKFAQLKTSADMNTSLNLITQNADTDTSVADNTPTGGEPQAPTGPDYTTQANHIKTAIQSTYPSLSDLVVTVTDSTVTISSNNGGFTGMGWSTFKPYIENELTGKTATYVSGNGTPTITYSIN